MPSAPLAPAPPTIVFAGGGSGGHIVPGLAIAERLVEMDASARTVFACSDRSIDSLMLTDAGVRFEPLAARPPSLRPAAALRFVRSFRAVKMKSRRLLREHGACGVVALGGFVAAPVVAAARAEGVPVTLVNLDDPPGRANRWMARRCDRVLSAVALPSMPAFASRVVGMPLRRASLADAPPAECRRALGLDAARPTLLVTGASQGSQSINRFVTAFAAASAAALEDWQVYHLAGHGADGPVREAYARSGVVAVVEPFQTRMGRAWGAADLAVSRAGASSVAEAAANAVPTLFLPYPYHRDRHQWRNAAPLVDAGGAAVSKDHVDSGRNLATVGPLLASLLGDAAARAQMHRRLAARAGGDAAATIAGILLGEASPESSGGGEPEPGSP